VAQAVFCEHVNELSAAIEYVEFTDHVSDCQLLKKTLKLFNMIILKLFVCCINAES
jgi:hypothetical protein